MEKNQPSALMGAEKPDDFLIVGIGASAGGIQALKEFFQEVPADSGMAYVVILHLSPDHDSQLAEVLQAATDIPVTQVTEKVIIQPDHIYVVSPNHHLIMEENYIAPSPNVLVEDRRAPVDIFFRTLADTHGPRAICVVLSGTGANGSMGLKRVKEKGGVAYVQSPREAAFNEMPRNSIATDLVDDVLPVAEIPAKIMAYRDSLGTVEITIDAIKRPEEQQKALREIFTQLRLHTGHDFINYKRATLLRRIERRINIRNLPDLPAYVDFLQQNPDETKALLKDLLISVTNFFRDRKPFEAVETEVVPAILQAKGVEDEIRVWVAGCATGEEAYSLAMLFAERTIGTIDPPKISIFATDIDETAIATARDGFYTLNDAADVSPERLNRFFVKEDEGYRIRKEIREMILFAHHNFLKDPPFSRLHLISCRNVLIYLNHTAQERVMETFHFALKPGGYLFLGTSESVDGASDLYGVLNRESHIFQARTVLARHFPVPDAGSSFRFPTADLHQKGNNGTNGSQSKISFGELHQRMLEEYAPPSVVVNEEYEIVHLSQKAGKYLEFIGGEPTQNLLKLVRPELRLELRSALYQAVQRQSAVETKSLALTMNGEPESINLLVRPAMPEGDGTKGFFLVIFEPAGAGGEAGEAMFSPDEPVAKHLEEELIRLKSQLRGLVEHHEYQAEELKASNEELQAMNEELRSAAEELETSKEELQSINEELRTVNQELKIKIDEITLTSNNVQNLINSSDVGTIFLDRSFRIRLFTPVARDIFNLIPTDYGRPISDITNKLHYTTLLADAELVLDKLTMVEREVATNDNRFFVMRLLPYRTSDDRINGVVVTFFDVTKRRLAEKALQQSEEHLRLLIESAKDYAIFTLDTARRITTWSSGAEAILGYTEAEVTGQSGDIIYTPEDKQNGDSQKEADTAANEGRAQNEGWYLRKDGSRFWGSGSVSPLRDSDGTGIGFVKILRDLTQSKLAEQAKFFLASIVESSNDSIITVNLERTITSWNKSAEALYGYAAEEAIGKSLAMLSLPKDLAGMLGKIDEIQRSRQVAVFDTVRINKDGRQMDLEIVMSPVLNASDAVIGVSTIARNISERKRREAQLAFLADLSQDVGRLHSFEYDFATKEVRGTYPGGEGLENLQPEPKTAENFLSQMMEEDRPEVEAMMRKAVDEQTIYHVEFRIRSKGGGIRWIKSSGRALYGTSNEPQKLIGITLDITAQKLFTEELRKQVAERTAELQRSNEDLRQFAHVISHDLKEPVRKIKTFHKRIADEYNEMLPEKAKQYLNKIDSSTNRMYAMIEGVLSYAKLTNLQQVVQPVDLNAVVQDIEADLEVLIEQKKANITRRDLPVVNANRILLYQLFYNLILNALKFAKNGEPSLITLSSEAVEQEGKRFVKLMLSDNGIGFEQEYAEDIFVTFTRLNSADDYEGTGLGLSLCRKIVERHGGTITASGEMGKGATFTILLPY